MTEKEWKAIEDLVAVDITRFISQKFIHPWKTGSSRSYARVKKCPSQRKKATQNLPA
jgi:hypothetical protein